jgi:hypothetical protein
LKIRSAPFITFFTNRIARWLILAYNSPSAKFARQIFARQIFAP